MADTKTTAEAAASALGGTELVRGVQSAANVKITIDQIKTWCSSSPTLVTPELGNATAVTITTSAAVLSGSDVKANTTSYFYWLNRSQMSAPADGVVLFQNWAADGFTGLKFGLTTSAAPYLKRNGVGLEVKLADDSAFTTVKGKLTTDTAATTGLTAGVLSALTNASMVWYDGAGQAYRVPCII